MTPADLNRVVFDCNVYAQALINPKGPAGACLVAAQDGRIILFISEYVIQEIRELPTKLKAGLGVTAEVVERLILDVAKYAQPIDQVPQLYMHPHDPDDSHYINLAMVAKAMLIVSRDRHLLNLMDEARPDGREFKKQFPSLTVLTPDVFADRLRAQEMQPQ